MKIKIFGVWLFCLLVACGGGGGDEGGDGLRFTADKSSIELSYEEGSPFQASASVYVTANGTRPDNLYIGAELEGQGISSYMPLTVLSETRGRFDISAESGLAAGTYTGKISIYACSDQNCTQPPIGGCVQF